MDASRDGCWNARCLTGTSRCSRSPGASRLAEDQVVLVDVARDGQRNVVAGPRMIHLPVLDLHRTDRLDKIGRMAPDVDAIAHSERRREADPGDRKMAEPVGDGANRLSGLVLLGHAGPPSCPHTASAQRTPEYDNRRDERFMPQLLHGPSAGASPPGGGPRRPLEQGELQARSWPARCHQEVRRRIRFVDAFTVPTTYWHRLDDGRVQCDLCPP